MTDACYNSYSFTTEERRNFDMSWLWPNYSVITNCSADYTYGATVSEILSTSACSAFVYKSEEDLGTILYWGTNAFYSGGGYVASLGADPVYASNMLLALESLNWLDIYTRAVFIEFNVWNANTNLFNQIQIVFEFSSYGSVVSNARVDSIDLYRYSGSRGVLNMVSEILCVFFVIFLTVRTIVEMIRHHEALISLWNWLLIVSFILFYVSVILYAVRSYLTVGALDTAMNSASKYYYYCSSKFDILEFLLS